MACMRTSLENETGRSKCNVICTYNRRPTRSRIIVHRSTEPNRTSIARQLESDHPAAAGSILALIAGNVAGYALGAGGVARLAGAVAARDVARGAAVLAAAFVVLYAGAMAALAVRRLEHVHDAEARGDDAAGKWPRSPARAPA